MAIPWAAIPEGTRVKVKQGVFPLDPELIGRTGVVVAATEYQTENVGIALDNSTDVRYFSVDELEVISQAALPPDRESAKQRRALP
jgi:hypothetical protein